MLSNKVVVVTGGAGRIGSAVCETVLKQDGSVVIADVNVQLALDLKEQLTQKGYSKERIRAIGLDITSKTSLMEAITTIDAYFGQIDVLVNNAYPRNLNYGKSFFDVEYEDFCDNTSMNLGGYFLTSQKFAEYFKAQGFGNIINVASIYGVVAPRFEIYDQTQMTMPVEYAAIKAGILQLTKYMAKLFYGSSIRVNAISPGGILDQQPQVFLDHYQEHCASKGMLETADVIGTFMFLMSDHSKYINGQNLVVDDGFTL